MPFVTDSRFAGYLGPVNPPPPPSPGTPPDGPLTDDLWENFLHDLIAGVTGLDNTLVRPRWQTEPPLRPDIGVNWVAFGVTNTQADYAPVFYHIDDGVVGYDALQQMEEHTIMCSFYGPAGEKYCSYFQRGLWVDQNQASMRANAVGLVSVGGQTRAAELVKERWWPRTDVQFILRREVRYNYNVLNLLQAQVDIKANSVGETRIIEETVTTPLPPTKLVISAGASGTALQITPNGVMGAGTTTP